MEIKINKEIRDYTESIFFGLSLRQFIFSLFALAVAVLSYFLLKPYLSIETLSWLCILCASPFAGLGFINYHGLNAEQLFTAWLRSEVTGPKKLKFESEPLTYKIMKEYIAKQIKEKKTNDKNTADLI